MVTCIFHYIVRVSSCCVFRLCYFGAVTPYVLIGKHKRVEEESCLLRQLQCKHITVTTRFRVFGMYVNCDCCEFYVLLIFLFRYVRNSNVTIITLTNITSDV
jgi:hypothetical protein